MLNCKERRKEIIKILEINNQISINELVSKFHVTEQAIYRDLKYLEKNNKINRTSKGAISSQLKAITRSLNFNNEETLFLNEKEAITKFASTLIDNGDSLYIAGGSTTLLFATNLIEKKSLIVITNTDSIGTIIKKEKRNRAILIGGLLLKETHTTVGKLAQSVISKHKVNKTILGINAIDVETGSFYTDIQEEAIIKKEMIKSCHELIILADSSKLSSKKTHFICDYTLNKKITLITDSKININHKKALETKNIKVITVF